MDINNFITEKPIEFGIILIVIGLIFLPWAIRGIKKLYKDVFIDNGSGDAHAFGSVVPIIIILLGIYVILEELFKFH